MFIEFSRDAVCAHTLSCEQRTDTGLQCFIVDEKTEKRRDTRRSDTDGLKYRERERTRWNGRQFNFFKDSVTV
jgi:hypothetical protein